MTDNHASGQDPHAPTDILAEILSARNIRLRWHGPLERGTRYQIWRRLNESGPFVRIGSESGVQANTYTDTGVPEPTREVSYYVVAECEGRTSIGSSEVVTVNLSAAEAA